MRAAALSACARQAPAALVDPGAVPTHDQEVERPGRDAREAIKEDNPRSDHPVPTLPNEPKPKPVVLVPNAPYPDGAPLSTVPPDLLAKLPKLPKPLEYRFVGGHLILHDAEASLVVDFLPQVVS